jgi:hypothetical protein
MKRAIFLLWITSGCGAVMCSLTGNAIGSCPGLKQASAQTQAAPENNSESSTPESSSSESNQTENASSSKPAADPNCRASGATCDQSYQCCSGACVTHSPDNYCR